MGLCHLCLEDKKLIKAHILSDGILKRIGDNKQRHVSAELHNLQNHSVKQDGYWDKNILCWDCDSTFSPVEQYFQSFISNRINSPDRKIDTNEGEILVYHNVDENKLRLFPLITLWRMSISKTESCRGVNLGPLEKIVYDCVKNLNPGPYNFFPFCIYSLKDMDDGRATFIGDPLPYKIAGRQHYMLPISDFFIAIRAGKNIDEKNLKTSVSHNTIEIVNLKGKMGTFFLDSIFPTFKAMPRHKDI